jgi:hypothetical protein
VQGYVAYTRGGHRRTKGLLALSAALVALGAFAGAATAGEGSSPEAKQALQGAVEAVGTPGQPAVGDATLALHELQLSYPDLHGADKRRARALLQRPPKGEEGPAEQQLGSGWNAPEAAESPVCTKHFCVHWVDSGGDAPPAHDNDNHADGDGVPDYVEKIQRTVEQSYVKENKKLGWPKAPGDGHRGGNSKIDVYLSQIGNVGLFGYANTDQGQNSKSNRRFSYLVLDNDYKEFAPLTPLAALQVTVAHEYNHILQFGIDYNEQLWMFEASATWMEEQVFPAVSDWLRYVPAFAASTADPISQGSAGDGLKIYGDASFLHFLSRGAGLGPDVVRDAWLRSPKVKPRHFANSAIDSSIRHNGGPGLGKLFSRFAAATAEWNAEPKKFPDSTRLAQVTRAGKLKLNESKRTKLDHLAFELYKVRPGKATKLKLHVDAEKGTQSAIALVGRSGSLKQGKVVSNVTYLKKGGNGVVRLRNVQRFDRITAVISNSDGRAKGTNAKGSPGFGGDNSAYSVRLSGARGSTACRCRP